MYKFKKCTYKGRFTWYAFVACNKLTTGLRHELFHVNQSYNSLTTAVYITKNVIGFQNMLQNPMKIVHVGNVE